MRSAGKNEGGAMIKRLLFVWMGLFLVVSGGFAQAPEKPKIAIAVGGKSLFYYLPLTIAERMGYFNEEGLTVEISDFAGAQRRCRR
jgi:NitT/TauT family transport system substrate-binding protein